MSASSTGRLSPATERRIALLLIQQAAQLEERAQQDGVTAFCGRALQRERPNERFLTSTLRNVASHNRRTQEQTMWAAWDKGRRSDRQDRPPSGGSGASGRSGGRSRGRSRSPSRQPRCSPSSSSRHGRTPSPHNPSSRSCSPCARRGGQDARLETCTDNGGGARLAAPASPGGSPRASSSASGSSSTSSGDANPSSAGGERAAKRARAAWADVEAGGGGASPPPGMTDDELRLWLSRSGRVRGRGDTGPRADEPGPYLPAPPGGQESEGAARTLGPTRPAWQVAAAEAGGGRQRLVAAQGFLRSLSAALGDGPCSRRGAGGGADGRSAKKKRSRAERKHGKRRKKEKKERKEKKRRKDYAADCND